MILTPMASFGLFFSVLLLAFSIEYVTSHEKSLVQTYSENGRFLLVLSTLNGSLIGIDQRSGEVKWKVQNEPAVKVVGKSKHLIPFFLPDPKDGSLYVMKGGEDKKYCVTKLPVSIQQLVADSPSRTKDGIFYMGRKIDSWFSIHTETGEKNAFYDVNSFEKICPAEQISDLFFVGRTDYNLAVYDSKKRRHHWNITFSDYSARGFSTEQLRDYGLLHVSSSASGRVRTFDRVSGKLIWEHDFGSPMVALYLQQGFDIYTVPFTSAAEASLNFLPFLVDQDQLKSTLYIGEHGDGLYALPSLADKDVPIVTEGSLRYLIGGPDSNPGLEALPPPVTLGHYKVSAINSGPLQIADHSQGPIQANSSSVAVARRHPPSRNHRPSVEEDQSYAMADSLETRYLTAIVFLLALFVFAMFIYFSRQMRDIKQSSQGMSVKHNYQMNLSAVQYQSEPGVVTIGKISFNTQEILGHGCNGTVVYRGKFEDRNVAVKRLLPECFTIADREVCLLRESDSHSNVVRYFSTEQDAQFRYIALELCTATLHDYVEKGIHKEDISIAEVLKQATSGLEHLHSLNIVHRDIKPHNILLVNNPEHRMVRTLISDFGLCKKLQDGKNSFSFQSGIKGTEGWIAPEMMVAESSQAKMRSSVDIFSLGCVFYYTVVGKHPFGHDVHPIKRQNNILSGEHKLSHLKDELWKNLILAMISFDPQKRPRAASVRRHPVFWLKLQVLAFLQDMSDRFEKELAGESDTLLELERGGEAVYGEGWKEKLDEEVSSDLGKYRSYRKNSVRDLLRALRNKKHHYRELSPAAQQLLGSTADSYVDYWLVRFPLLLCHVWTSMQILRTESSFHLYFDAEYLFPFDKSDTVPPWFYEPLPEKNSHFPSNSSSFRGVHRRRKSSSTQVTSPRDKTIAEGCGDKNDKEAWIKAGEVNGAWRPRVLLQRKEEEETNMIRRVCSEFGSKKKD